MSTNWNFLSQIEMYDSETRSLALFLFEQFKHIFEFTSIDSNESDDKIHVRVQFKIKEMTVNLYLYKNDFVWKTKHIQISLNSSFVSLEYLPCYQNFEEFLSQHTHQLQTNKNDISFYYKKVAVQCLSIFSCSEQIIGDLSRIREREKEKKEKINYFITECHASCINTSEIGQIIIDPEKLEQHEIEQLVALLNGAKN